VASGCDVRPRSRYRLFYRYFGLSLLLYAGSLGFIGSILLFVTGTSTFNFVGGLVLLGISWNFCYFSATMLLVTTIPKPSQAKAQTANEFVVMSSGAIASGLAGVVLAGAGWTILLTSVSSVIGLLTVIAGAAIRANRRYNKAPLGVLQ
jgi:hypothetical protein